MQRERERERDNKYAFGFGRRVVAFGHERAASLVQYSIERENTGRLARRPTGLSGALHGAQQ